MEYTMGSCSNMFSRRVVMYVLPTITILIPLINASPPIRTFQNAREVLASRNTHEIDVTGWSGVYLREEDRSQLHISNFKFPSIRSEPDTSQTVITFSFKTASENGLMFSANSHLKGHQLLVYIEDGAVHIKISGRCHWLFLRDSISDPVIVSDSRIHQFRLKSSAEDGISLQIDSQPERRFFYASHANFKCWHVDRLYFGLPQLDLTELSSRDSRLMRRRIDGCITDFEILQLPSSMETTTHGGRNIRPTDVISSTNQGLRKDSINTEILTILNTDDQEVMTTPINILYQRVSSCSHNTQSNTIDR